MFTRNYSIFSGLKKYYNIKNIKNTRNLSKTVKITFVDRDDDEEVVEAKLGDSLLDVALDNDIDIEGACGGEIACSTCHLIFDKTTFDS